NRIACRSAVECRQFSGGLRQTVEREPAREGERLVEGLLDVVPETLGAQLAGVDQRRKTEAGGPRRAPDLFFGAPKARYDNWTLAKIDGLGERVVTPHANDGIGGAHRRHVVGVEFRESQVRLSSSQGDDLLPLGHGEEWSQYHVGENRRSRARTQPLE